MYAGVNTGKHCSMDKAIPMYVYRRVGILSFFGYISSNGEISKTYTSSTELHESIGLVDFLAPQAPRIKCLTNMMIRKEEKKKGTQPLRKRK